MNMSPMSNDSNQALFDLVTEYETTCNQGTTIFFHEEDYLKLIEYYEKDEQLERALEVVDHALMSHAFSLDFYLRKAHLLIDVNREQQALDILDQAALIAPNEMAVALLKAEAMIYLNRIDEALTLLDDSKFETDCETLSDIYLVESIAHEHEEEFELMFYALKAALQENPKNKEALERLWLAVELARKYEESIQLHEDIINEDPYSYLAWYNLGHAYAYIGNYGEAIDAYEYAFIINDQFEYAYRDCAELCFEMKHFRKALSCYEEIVENGFEEDSELLLRIGQCFQELEDFQKAQQSYRKAIRLDSLNDEVYFHIGQCYAQEGKWKSAVRSYNRAINIENNREEYYAALARANWEMGEHEKAESCFRMALEIAPEQTEYWILFTAFLMATDRQDEILEVIDEAEELAVGGPELLYSRIAVLFYLGRRQEAYYWLGEALEEDFQTHPMLFELLPELEHDPGVVSIITGYLH